MVRVVVAGAGVVGMSSAIQLLRAGYKDVTVVARDLSPLTTSDGAGAIWRPFVFISQHHITLFFS
jgi:glycine/D-amino acid oxidase-like deaminating enzyme